MSEPVKTWSEWLSITRFVGDSDAEISATTALLLQIRDKILDRANLKPDDVFLDVGTGMGLVAFGAFERLQKMNSCNNAWKVIASDAFDDCLQSCYDMARHYGIEKEIIFIKSDAASLEIPDNSVDVVATRSVLVHIIDKPAVINEFYRVLKSGGRYSCYEAIMSKNTKFYELINPDNFLNYSKLKEIEDKIASDCNNPLVNFDEDSLRTDLENAGFKNIDIIPADQFSSMELSKENIENYFNMTLSVGQPTVKEKFLQYISENEFIELVENLKKALGDKIININLPKVFISAEKY